MGLVDYNTFSTLSLLRDSIKWYQSNNTLGRFDRALEIEEGAYQQWLKLARSA